MKQNQNLLIVSQMSESFDVSSGCIIVKLKMKMNKNEFQLAAY